MVRYRIWARAVAAMVGAVIAVAAILKIFAPATRFSLFGAVAQTVPWVAWVVVVVELLLGLWLISGWRFSVAALLALLLISLFSGMIMHDMTLHYPEPCGCFGQAWLQAHEPATIERGLALDLGRNMLLLAGVAAVLVAGRRGRRMIGMPEAPRMIEAEADAGRR